MDRLSLHVESLLFAAGAPVALKEIKQTLEAALEQAFSEEELVGALDRLRDRYRDEAFAIEVVEISGGFQFMTKPAFHQTIGVYLKQSARKRLSRAALETLSIVAYKQPVTKAEVEKVRGVNCDYSLQKLLEKELVTIIGRREGPGRPLLYGTSEKFMDHFGLKSLQDLPQPKDFKQPEHAIGEQAPIEEEAGSGDPDGNSS